MTNLVGMVLLVAPVLIVVAGWAFVAARARRDEVQSPPVAEPSE